MSNIKLNKIAEYIQNADAIVIGAGAGLSASAGLLYSGKRFTDNFSEFIDKYGMQDMYSSGFYPFETEEEKWAYWSKHIYLNRYEFPVGEVYKDLLEIVSGKKYFIITTNVDHQFYKAGFSKERVFATQGDYGLLQCAHGCHKKLYDNEALVYKMVEKQKDCRIPSELVPKCPVCGEEMEVNLRCDEYFVEDEEWDNSLANYERFIEENQNKNIVFIELGVGMNTPAIIKYQFWRMTNKLKDAKYICINLNEAYAPGAIMNKSICIESDISEAVNDLKKLIK
ncbi:SIR2 family NAD-dependent protein deacylase [Clostridium nigeriense]|uniref:SIR2 family NAD-dependent protein deacylase n=1 Tax=Clostridium nigeriense TaxID=1805470 RepID=UPI003D34F13E